MPRDDDNPQRREYRPSDQLAPPQPDHSWRENGSKRAVPTDDLSWEPDGFRHVPKPARAPEPITAEDPGLPLDEMTDIPPAQELGIMTPPLEPDEVFDPDDAPEAPTSRQWQEPDAPDEKASSAVSPLRATPRAADPRVPADPEGLSVQERYEILLHTIGLYQNDWKLWRIRAHEESGKLQAILIPRQGAMSVREAYDRDQVLMITVDTEGNTDIREPSRRKSRGGWKFWGGSG